jgi:ABC-type transport system involved in cytochrome bd biosynthesis fused ATPase/permease subunit
MQNVYSSISKAFSGKGDLDALSRALKQYNIELVEGAKDAALFTNAAKAFSSALKSNNQSIKESENKQKELERTWQESLEAFQKLNIALGEGDKFG